MPTNDLIIDANTMGLYGTPAAKSHKAMFSWLGCCGSLCWSRPILGEYQKQGSPLVAAIVDTLMKEGRFSFIKRSTLESFEVMDRNYPYTCNHEDIPVARTVFRSYRKLLVSADRRLLSDVNGFRVVGGIKSKAMKVLLAEYLVSSQRFSCKCGAH